MENKPTLNRPVSIANDEFFDEVRFNKDIKVGLILEDEYGCKYEVLKVTWKPFVGESMLLRLKKI